MSIDFVHNFYDFLQEFSTGFWAFGCIKNENRWEIAAESEVGCGGYGTEAGKSVRVGSGVELS